jgi:ABC-type Na+ transport system ATPase subunit NatA
MYYDLRKEITMTAAPLIELQDLSKNYGPKTDVDHVSLHVFGGEEFGFLGPNGADKTTTIKLLLGHPRPTGGSAHVFGHDIQQESVFIRKPIGQPLTSVTSIIGTALMYPVSTVISIPRFEREEF